jgi:hypothetical protein
MLERKILDRKLLQRTCLDPSPTFAGSAFGTHCLSCSRNYFPTYQLFANVVASDVENRCGTSRGDRAVDQKARKPFRSRAGNGFDPASRSSVLPGRSDRSV